MKYFFKQAYLHFMHLILQSLAPSFEIVSAAQIVCAL